MRPVNTSKWTNPIQQGLTTWDYQSGADFTPPSDSVRCLRIAEYRDPELFDWLRDYEVDRPEPQAVIAGVAVPESELLVLAYRRLMLAAGRATNKRRGKRAA